MAIVPSLQSLNETKEERSAHMKKVLVSGGAGFIGSHLCDKLIARGDLVYCVDNLYTGSQTNIHQHKDDPNFVFINLDVSDVFELEVSEIYNLACPASPAHYQSNPMFTIETSVNGAIHMVELAQRTNSKLFQASTSEVYGEPTVHPQPETYYGNVNPIGPRSAYDESKRLAETILFVHYHQMPYKLKLGRIFNTYGPRMLVDDGRIISNFINQAIRNEDITIYGDGSQTRSFCYIDDMVDAILKFMETEDTVIGPINLGSEFEYSVLDIADLIIKLTDSKSEIVYLPLPMNDPLHRRPETTLAKKLLNWEATTPIAVGMVKTIEYYRSLLHIPIL